MQLADTLVETGHAHAPSIKTWVEEVDVTYKDFSTRMDKYRARLQQSLGIPGAVERQISAQSPTSPTSSLNLDATDRHSDSSLESKFSKDSAIGSSDAPSTQSSTLATISKKSSSNSSLNKLSSASPAAVTPTTATDLKHLKQIKELTEEKRRSTRRKEFIMSELLETERSYVKDLEMAVNCFLKPMRQAGSDRDKIPAPLRGKEHIIFGNVEELLCFHKQIFLKELEK